ncbi:MAG: hypothetical protein K2W96_16105 [Gemmataceae bacterium]|nr:hypothetical protein [Gemmataceae bacterium]
MKSIEYGKWSRTPEEASALAQATEYLEEVLEASAGQVEAKWERDVDSKLRPMYRLTISDQTDKATASFSLDELSWTHLLKSKLYVLWGKILQARNEKLLKEALATPV